MKFISPKVHAVLDYLVAAFLIVAPHFIMLSEKATYLSVVLGVIHFALTVLTKFKGGIVKLISLPIHGMIEFLVSLVLGVLAFTVFRNNQADQLYWSVLAVAIMLVFLCTDYKAKDPN